MGYTLDATENNKQSYCGQDDSNPYGRPAKGFLHGTADGVGLDGIVG